MPPSRPAIATRRAPSPSSTCCRLSAMPSRRTSRASRPTPIWSMRAPSSGSPREARFSSPARECNEALRRPGPRRPMGGNRFVTCNGGNDVRRPASHTSRSSVQKVGEALVEMAATPVRTSRRRVWFVAVAGVLAVIVVLAGIKAGQIGAMIKSGKSFVLPPEAVTSAKVEAVRWQASRAAVATLVAVRAVTVASEVLGLVREIGFDSGTFVRRGDILVKLDTSTEEAQLAAAEADAALARVTARRARPLREANSNTPADLDAAESRTQQAAANAATPKATSANKTIRAPFDER